MKGGLTLTVVVAAAMAVLEPFRKGPPVSGGAPVHVGVLEDLILVAF